MASLYAPVRQQLDSPRKPSSRLPKSLRPHTAWLRGRLLKLGAISQAEANLALARCLTPRARRAYSIGLAAPRTAPVLTPVELDEVLDLLEALDRSSAPCTCDPALWRNTHRRLCRHMVACPRWGSPVAR